MSGLEQRVSRRGLLRQGAKLGVGGLLVTSGTALDSRVTLAVPHTPTLVEKPAFVQKEKMILDPEISRRAAEAFMDEGAGYPDWKRLYLLSEGLPLGQIKVQYSSDSGTNDTASEVNAYGMIYAVNADDRDTFDGIWNFTQDHLNKAGLPMWRLNPDNTPNHDDGGNASAADADLDMAYALVAAEMRWGGYTDQAIAMMDRILEYDIEPGTYVLKGGHDWGGSNETNPSYYSPGYYQLFQDFSGNHEWGRVAEAGRTVFDAIYNKRGTLLPPNWSTADGAEVPIRDGEEPNQKNDIYGYEAIRVPWRQGMAGLWYPDNPVVSGHAVEILGRINSFFESVAPDNVRGGYDPISGKPLVGWTEVAFTGTTAIAATLSELPGFQEKLLEHTIEARNIDWVTNESMRLISMLLLSDNMIH
jgi:endo-1,4-beta-D-glucanase Y